MNAIRPSARPSVLERRPPFPFVWFDPRAIVPRIVGTPRPRRAIGTWKSSSPILPWRPLVLTSNTRSVSCAHKEVSVTKHDADRKIRILDYIAATLRARGFPPSVREIAKAVGLASTSAVHHHLQILEREGYLERGAAQSRAIRLTPTAAIRLGLTSELVPQSTAGDARVVPVIGEIAAGGPIEAYQDATETMAIPDILAPGGDAYVLRVRGDSMIEAHIADGDF